MGCSVQRIMLLLEITQTIMWAKRGQLKFFASLLKMLAIMKAVAKVAFARQDHVLLSAILCMIISDRGLN